MSDIDSRKHLSEPVDLSREVYAEGGDYQLLCCMGTGREHWVSAAEIVYEFTGNPGSVVRNTITFDLDSDSSIDINLLDGSFELKESEAVVGKGRKGIELLMSWKAMSLDEALDWVASTYSEESADVMKEDYARMRNPVGRRTEG